MVEQEQPVLVVASGTQTVDDRKIAALFHVGRKKVRLAAYSARKLPLIPRQSCHLFHAKVATNSRAKLPVIPRESCQ
jgi:hypothetical protein